MKNTIKTVRIVLDQVTAEEWLQNPDTLITTEESMETYKDEVQKRMKTQWPDAQVFIRWAQVGDRSGGDRAYMTGDFDDPALEIDAEQEVQADLCLIFEAMGNDWSWLPTGGE